MKETFGLPRCNVQWMRACRAGLCAAVACLAGGCDVTVPIDTGGGGGGTLTDGNRDTTLTSTLGKTSGEPNDSFDDPIIAVFDSDGLALLQGSIPRTGDLDVYALGPLAPGDLIVVDADTTAVRSALDISLAIFDSFGRLAVENDDRVEQDLDSRIEWIVRHDSPVYYLVATHSSFAPTGRFTGTYQIDVQVTSGLDVPQPVEQILLLDYRGAFIDTPSLGSMNLAAFSASAISPRYLGQDETIKQSIRRTVEQNYERFDVIIRTSDDAPIAEGVLYSTAYIGDLDETTFGVAENVDLYNADFCDDAIVFAESFDASIFQTPPTADELGVAIGNIVAHESGHLLGLNHVDDDTALMDDQSAPDAFLFDQEFKEAKLSSDIMSIGVQDAALLLSEIVGPSDGFDAMRRFDATRGR